MLEKKTKVKTAMQNNSGLKSFDRTLFREISPTWTNQHAVKPLTVIHMNFAWDLFLYLS